MQSKKHQLQLGASGDQSLALVVAGVLDEVLLEAGSQILGLCFPLSSVSVGISGIQDAAVNYSLGPASTRALPSSLPVYLLKFLMKRAARS